MNDTPPIDPAAFASSATHLDPFYAILSIVVAVVFIAILLGIEAAATPREKRWSTVLRAAAPWLMVVVGLTALTLWFRHYVNDAARGEELAIKHPHAFWLWPSAMLVGWIAFTLQRHRAAAVGFSQTAFVRSRGVGAWLSDLPAVLRVLAMFMLVAAFMRPETFRTVKKEEDSVDIMIVFDMSKSMEEADMPRDRMDAAQRVIRRFLHRTTHDRVGLVIFGQQAMLQCPLTEDSRLLEDIVRDLNIGDVPALGTAIGDGLALALAQLRRADGTCDPTADSPTCGPDLLCGSDGYCKTEKKNKVVILLSDGDSNMRLRFDPDEAANAARAMGVKVYTVLVGRESNDWLGFGGGVNPETLRSIALGTGGEFFRATDYESFDRGFQTVRNQLDKQKRVTYERIAGKALYIPFGIAAAILIGLGLLLSHTALRRLP
ncbi:MAG TPA: VWA domain-containing protein [Kofleriaceae bacterium]|jgi:Ca-activated chloride channel family protein